MRRDLPSVLLAALELTVAMFVFEHGDHPAGCWRCAALRDELDLVERALADALAEVFDGQPLEAAA